MNRDKKRYWLYGRVASPDTWALENQMNYLRSFAEKHQLNVVGESQDEASGLTFDRPGLNDFLEAVRQGRADALLIKDFARLGRDSGWVMELIADLNSAGIGVFSVTDLMPARIRRRCFLPSREGDHRRVPCDIFMEKRHIDGFGRRRAPA